MSEPMSEPDTSEPRRDEPATGEPRPAIPGRPPWWSRTHIRAFHLEEEEIWRILTTADLAAVSWVTARAEPVTALLSYLFIDDHLTVTSTSNRSKYRAWSANPAACFCVWDPEDQLKQVTVRGQVEMFRTEEFHRRWIEALVAKVSGRDDLPAEVLERQFRLFDDPDRRYFRLHISRILSYDGRMMREAEREGLDVWPELPVE